MLVDAALVVRVRLLRPNPRPPAAVERDAVAGGGLLELFFCDAFVTKNLLNVGDLCLSGWW